jgi:hypothetical protein
VGRIVLLAIGVAASLIDIDIGQIERLPSVASSEQPVGRGSKIIIKAVDAQGL